MRARAVLEKRLSAEDPLTGALNRRAFLELAAYEVRRSRRSGKPLSVVMADVDHFKPVNDTHGHFVGDEVLVELVRRLRATLREVDAICRWGGEEFVLLFPDAGGDSAARVAERARMAVARTPVATSAGEMSVTLTLGVAVVGDDFEAAVDAADRALYQGKRAGRDRVVVANGSPDRARLRSDEPGSSGP
ncbi:GGDEF domain-containing protein [Alkalisalibacterium limincola]